MASTTSEIQQSESQKKDEKDNPIANGGRLLVSSSLVNLIQQRKVRLILASQSPRRAEILDMMGLQGYYLTIPSPLNEEAVQKELASSASCSPSEYAQTLACRKAQALGFALVDPNHEHYESIQDKITSWESTNAKLGPALEATTSPEHDVSQTTTIILGSDTIVDLNNTILEKPASPIQAQSMLHQLSNHWHKVHTGVALYTIQPHEPQNLAKAFTTTTRVKFTELSKEDVEAYVGTGEPMDKAGAYGIQGVGGQLVEDMEGDFFAVMGLPMHRTSLELCGLLKELERL